MKKSVIMVLVCIMACGVSFAQTKGMRYINGVVGGTLQVDKSSQMNSWSLGLSPEYGVFVADRLSVGGFVNLQYGHSKSEMFVGQKVVNNWMQFDLGGTVRYHLPIARWLSYTPAAYVGLTPYTRTWNADGHNVPKVVSFWGRLQIVSFDFNISEKFAVNLDLLDYALITSTNKTLQGSGHSIGVSPRISLKFYF